MPVQIGAKAHNFTDPTGLLSDCHRRVEMFLGMLEAVGEVIDQPAAGETSRALDSALRYFGEARPSTPLIRKTRCFHGCASSTVSRVTRVLSRIATSERHKANRVLVKRPVFGRLLLQSWQRSGR